MAQFTNKRNVGLLAMAGALFALPACGDDADESTVGGGAQCGTVSEPKVVEITEVIPAVGSTVENAAIVHGFTAVAPGAMFQQFTFVMGAGHSAGQISPSSLQVAAIQQGNDIRYELNAVSWQTAPGDVEFGVADVFQTPDGCVLALPSPLFSYSVSPAAGGAGGGGGSAGGGGGSAGGGGGSAGGAGGGGGVGGSGGSGGSGN